MKAFLLALTLTALALIAQAAWQHFNPPFTSAQLASTGIADTWEPHAIITALLLVVVAIATLSVAALLVFGRTALRSHSAFALVALVIAGCTQLAAHIELTRQVTRATGQTFGGLYGLF